MSLKPSTLKPGDVVRYLTTGGVLIDCVFVERIVHGSDEPTSVLRSEAHAGLNGPDDAGLITIGDRQLSRRGKVIEAAPQQTGELLQVQHTFGAAPADPIAPPAFDRAPLLDANTPRPPVSTDDMRQSFLLMEEAARLSSKAYRLRAKAFALRGYDTSMISAANGYSSSYEAERAVLRECLETYPK